MYFFRTYHMQAGEDEDEEEELWDLEHRDPKRLGTFDLVRHEADSKDTRVTRLILVVVFKHISTNRQPSYVHNL